MYKLEPQINGLLRISVFLRLLFVNIYKIDPFTGVYSEVPTCGIPSISVKNNKQYV